MNYHLNVELRRMPGKATWNSSFDSFTTVLELLDDQHADILRQSFLWPLYQLREVQYSGQIIDALLCRLLSRVDGDAFHFDLGGKVVSFSMFEFALVTGLKITGDEAASKEIQRRNRLHDAYFQGQGAIILPQLIDAIRRCDQMLDRLKLGLVYILESVLRCHHKKTAIDIFHLEIVDDIDRFNNYHWGRRCFEDTVHVFTRSHSKPKGFVRKYNTYGLPLALQIWAYETVPLLGTRFAKRGGGYTLPSNVPLASISSRRMSNWETIIGSSRRPSS
ncbi:uncharacterized protein LOC111409242 isoform X1 [Olea europaea var. sylvestris]|uniref:uncharacterized protein LOC111409242 isoform X1 n=1 Tax=Olea europaea var. sylvestris TaxID=158386 RepID=UPI000C1CFAE9|nr:uncharacterized protein LOC111409242 isoform X1 [Olea europaea var. sylvestris]XP_022895030.1 uncharacterized protein LOC111409242 isoform X1 [Olea europaea var. sylvestris]XP_022895039.1 uncharacterized protein LOC111409242 isoform X1 [Olea europaea var. sylvestris]XP_022895046.1 uncharacterized protein LOC111409242 isoform X1 [Olea europaea var. sylvestris]XP_022895050.1 uncharacterized protein LOC111409242 isoform X1 [Olea europaea var. sylvestris]